jgi:release factor glutamine methyltransferase
MKTVGDALREATARLRASSTSARLDAEVLLAHVLRVSRAQLIAALGDALSDGAREQFEALVDRRAQLEPVAYLVGEREFYGMPLFVDKRVLVPRPETERLVDLALEAARRLDAGKELRIADIGTGSGAIAVAVAANAPRAHIWAVDLSADALEVARTNVQRHGLEDRVTLLQGAGLEPLPAPIDLLLSNPPYTKLDEVDENVRRYEPRLALDGGADGLAVIRELFDAAPRYIQHGIILMEIAAWQGRTAALIATETFPDASITVHHDLAGLDRILQVVAGL